MTDPINPPVVEPISDSANQAPTGTVAYETHRKLLDEKKKLQARVDQIEADRKASEESELIRKGDTQKLLDLAKKESAELRASLDAKIQREGQAKKMSAIVKGLGTSIDEKWYGVVGQHIDDVLVNAEGEVEQMSITAIVENLKKTWPEMLKKQAAGMPHDAPKGNSAGTITKDEWMKLPSKEMTKWNSDQII